MKSILSIYDFLPLLLLVLQTFILLACTVVVLRYFKILELPYAGMEQRKVLLGAIILVSVMIISFSDIQAMVQSVKTFRSYTDGFYRNVFIKFSQFILI